MKTTVYIVGIVREFRGNPISFGLDDMTVFFDKREALDAQEALRESVKHSGSPWHGCCHPDEIICVPHRQASGPLEFDLDAIYGKK